MFDFDALSHAISSRTVLCVGDLMLDEFVYGEVSRISPEAPAPVIAAQRSETNIGGAANVAIYRGATLLTPNRKEFAEATRSRADTDQSIADAAQDAMQLADCEAMLVTQSEHGMTLVPRNGEAIHVPALPVKVRDVSGAGDTVAAVLALALAAGADWETALRMANAAAAVAVGKKGTATVTRAELRRKILPHASLAAEEKIVPVGGDLDAHLADWRRQELRIGFTNGCFDILHPGHVKVLTAARRACDRLIVGR